MFRLNSRPRANAIIYSADNHEFCIPFSPTKDVIVMLYTVSSVSSNSATLTVPTDSPFLGNSRRQHLID